MNEISKLAVAVAKSRYEKEKKENELAKEQAEKCAKLIFEVFKVANITQAIVECKGTNLGCGVKWSEQDSEFSFLHQFKNGTPFYDAMKAIQKINSERNIIKYIVDFLSHDKDIIKYYSIEHDIKRDAVIVVLKDMNVIETICENEELTE